MPTFTDSEMLDWLAKKFSDVYQEPGAGFQTEVPQEVAYGIRFPLKFSQRDLRGVISSLMAAELKGEVQCN